MSCSPEDRGTLRLPFLRRVVSTGRGCVAISGQDPGTLLPPAIGLVLLAFYAATTALGRSRSPRLVVMSARTTPRPRSTTPTVKEPRPPSV